jgi:hypothetical protein
MGTDDNVALDGWRFDDDARRGLENATARLKAVIEEIKEDGAVIDRDLIQQVLRELDRFVQLGRCYVDGVEVPRHVWDAIMEAPTRTRKWMTEGVIVAYRALSSQHPRLHRILDNAAARRYEGQVFAEAAREVRDQKYRERVRWVADKYRQVRCKYGPETMGDKAARFEVAVAFQREHKRKKRMCDRTVCNILEEAARMESTANTETAGR